MAFDFMDIANRYLDRRVDQATQPFTDPSGYLENRINQRFGMDQEGANVTPRSTTISYNDDGTHTVSNKYDVGPPTEQAAMAQPLPGMEPYALPSPTQLAPPPSMAQPTPMALPQQQQPQVVVMPEQGPAVAQPAPQIEQPQPQPMAAPPAPQVAAPAPAPAAPVAPEPAAPAPQVAAAPAAPISPNALPPQLPALPQAGPGVQVAGGPGAPMPVTQPAEAAPAPAAPEVTRSWIDDVASIGNDSTKLAAYFGNTANDPEGRKFAGQLLKDSLTKTSEEMKAEKKANEAIAKGDLLPIMKEIKSRSEEGSYVKAYLFARLGLTDLARDEQKKLGAGSEWRAVTGPNNEKALINFSADGLPMRGIGADGQSLSDEKVVSLATNALPTKAHLLPSVHGTPVINAKGETGLIMYDPQTQSNYVQVGNERRSTAGWTSMAQNVQNVYAAAGAAAQGKGAGEGYKPTPLPAYPGGPAPAGTEITPAAPAQATAAAPQYTQKDLERAQSDVAALQREIKATGPNETKRLSILNSELTNAQQRLTQVSGAIQGLGAQGTTTSAAAPGATIAEQKKANAIAEAEAKEKIQVAGKRSESFNKILDEEIRPQAQAGDEIAQLRKQQFKIFDRPGVDASKIFGIANGAGQAPGDQRWTMLRDVLAGKVSEPEDKIRERAAALGLNRDEQSALAEYNNLNASVNARTLKSTAGAGSVSDAEQRANRERNVDPTQMPALGAYNSMAQSQFNADLARYKGDWAQNSKATNALQLDKDWRKEQQRLVDNYVNVAKDRLDYIAKNGSTAAAVKEGYRRFPIPEYDPQTETWKKTRPLSSFDR